MSEHSHPSPNERLREIASQLRYPPTPDMVEAVTKRLENGNRPRVRLRSVGAIVTLLALLLVLLFAVPGVRAEIVRFLQVGVVRIFPAAATQTAIPALPQLPLTATPLAVSPGTATPLATQNEPSSNITLAGLAGETTLEAAQTSLPFQIRLPNYPASLGAPERVFLQADGPMVILVWTDPQKVLLSLYEIGPGSVIIHKFEPRVIQETQVNGQYAVWVEGPYLVQLTDGSYEERMLVPGNTLIWEQNGITYRLESDLGLAEAIKIAESLK
jgi:Domain of unknown function (DUF4367)